MSKFGAGNKWSEEEVNYLIELTEVKMADGGPFPAAAIHIFYNNYFTALYGDKFNPRTNKAVSIKLGKLTTEGKIDKKRREELAKSGAKFSEGYDTEKLVSEMSEQIESKPKPKRKWARDNSVKNAGKGWSIKEEKYLLNNWEADISKRQEVADYLGRTISSCIGKYSSIKRTKGVKYMSGMMDNETIILDTVRGGVFSRLINWLNNKNQNRLMKKEIKKQERKKQRLAIQKKGKDAKLAELYEQIRRLEE